MKKPRKKLVAPIKQVRPVDPTTLVEVSGGIGVLPGETDQHNETIVRDRGRTSRRRRARR